MKLAKQYKIKFFETSAWTDVNIVEAFTALTEEILTDVSVSYMCVVAIRFITVYLQVKQKIQGERVEEGSVRPNIVLEKGQSVEGKVPSDGGGWCCSS